MEEEKKELSLFGRDLSEIPCFRTSWLYGISGGLGGGLLYFLFTSKTRHACHAGVISMLGITSATWCVCRWEHYKQYKELQKVKEYIEKRALLENEEIEKVHKVDIATVSHTPKQ